MTPGCSPTCIGILIATFKIWPDVKLYLSIVRWTKPRVRTLCVLLGDGCMTRCNSAYSGERCPPPSYFCCFSPGLIIWSLYFCAQEIRPTRGSKHCKSSMSCCTALSPDKTALSPCVQRRVAQTSPLAPPRYCPCWSAVRSEERRVGKEAGDRGGREG